MGGGRRSGPEGRGLIRLYSTLRGDAFLLRFALLFLYYILLLGGLVPRDLRTAHCRGRRIPFVVVDRPRAGYRLISFLSFLGRISLGDAWRCLLNKIKIK
jgi:hypothetical protein